MREESKGTIQRDQPKRIASMIEREVSSSQMGVNTKEIMYVLLLDNAVRHFALKKFNTKQRIFQGIEQC